MEHWLHVGLQAPAYDRLGDASSLEPTDVLAPALLDAPIRGVTVIEMFADGSGAPQSLLAALRAVVESSQCQTAHFEELDLEDETWRMVRSALIASEDVRGIAASKVTKILHRKLPDLVPIFDSKVAAYYGCSPRRPREFWPVLQQDVVDSTSLLDDLRSAFRTPDGRPLGRLRTLDIVVWEHVITGCGENQG